MALMQRRVKVESAMRVGEKGRVNVGCRVVCCCEMDASATRDSAWRHSYVGVQAQRKEEGRGEHMDRCET